MKIGIVGYQGSGKTTLWQWLTGVEPDLAQAHRAHTAMATIPEPRVQALCEVYHPKKITLAALELVDTPGLSRTHEGNATRLGMIRDCDCLVVIVAAFGGADPQADLASFEEDLLLADLEIASGRIERIEQQLKKPRPDRDQLIVELESLKPLVAALEQGTALREIERTAEQRKATKSFQLLTEKPRVVIVNVEDDESDPGRFGHAAPDGSPLVAVPLDMELELEQMSHEDRDEFLAEMGLTGFDRDGLVRTLMDASGQMLFFTCGEKEVRTWIIRKGGTALEAADAVHSDMARGFIRAETMTCDDLIRCGSERELKAQNLMRQEHKDYVIQEGEILYFKSGV